MPYLALVAAAAAGRGNLRTRATSSRFDSALALHWLGVIDSFGYLLSGAEAQLRVDCQRQLDEHAADLAEAADGVDGPTVEELIGDRRSGSGCQSS